MVDSSILILFMIASEIPSYYVHEKEAADRDSLENEDTATQQDGRDQGAL